MLRKTCILLSLLAALTAARLPLGFVQLGSWAGMFSDYVEQTGSVLVSLAWTFDGEHRCGGCVYVSEATADAEEQKKSATVDTSFSKIPFALLDLQFVVWNPQKFQVTCRRSCIFCPSLFRKLPFRHREFPKVRVTLGERLRPFLISRSRPLSIPARELFLVQGATVFARRARTIAQSATHFLLNKL